MITLRSGGQRSRSRKAENVRKNPFGEISQELSGEF